MKAARLVVLGIGVFHAAGALAGTVEVNAGRCADAIHIKAQDAPLGDVLARMSGAMGFRLDASVDLSERVTLDRKGPPARLLKNLLLGKNLVIRTAASKACGGQERIETVWVLPAGQDVPRRAASESPQATPSVQPSTEAPEARPARRHERPRGTRKSMSDEEWQQMKKDYKAGKIKADPETGKPVPVQPDEPAPVPEDAE